MYTSLADRHYIACKISHGRSGFYEIDHRLGSSVVRLCNGNVVVEITSDRQAKLWVSRGQLKSGENEMIEYDLPFPYRGRGWRRLAVLDLRRFIELARRDYDHRWPPLPWSDTPTLPPEK